MRYILGLIGLTVLLPGIAAAQPPATQTPVDHAQVISTNPFGLMLKVVNGEYERRVAPSTTVGVSGSYSGDSDFGNVAAVARWYPQGRALDGFYLGARVGAYGFRTVDYDYSAFETPSPTRGGPPYPYPTFHERTRVVPGAGFDIGYNWLLGAKENVAVGIGFGLARMLDNSGSYSIPEVWPNIRLVNIGVAF